MIAADTSLNGQAGGFGTAGGSFILNEGGLGSDLESLNTILNNGGFNESRTIRLRIGDLTVANGSSISARNVTLVADSGLVEIAGAITTGGHAGRFTLEGGSGVTLDSGAVLDASVTQSNLRFDAYGNPIDAVNRSIVTLAAGAGQITLAQGSSINVRTPYAAIGQVILRAPRLGTTDVAIYGAGGGNTAITGAQKLIIDATSKITSATVDLPTITAAANFVPSAATLGRLASLNNAQFRAAVEIDNPGAITLSPTDLSGLRPNGQPVDLIVRSSSDLNGMGIFGTISDGLVAGGLIAGDSASLIFTAGADLTSADPTALLPSAALAGQGNITNLTLITGTGAITLTAGGSMNNVSAATLGQADPTVLAGFTNPSGPYAGTPSYGINGGNVTLTAQGDITNPATYGITNVASPIIRAINSWLWRQGGDDGKYYPLTSQTTWYDNFANGTPEIGSAGGGNVTIISGGNLSEIFAMVGSTGRLASDGTLLIRGGGDLEVKAGGPIDGGLFYNARGRATIAAQIIGPNLANLPEYGLGDAQLTLHAANTLNIGTIFDPMMADQNPGNVVPSIAGVTLHDPHSGSPLSITNYWVSYTAQTAANVISDLGTISLVEASGQTDAAFPAAGLGETSYPHDLIPTSFERNTPADPILPSNFIATNFTGDINIGSNFDNAGSPAIPRNAILLPSPRSDLELLASGQITADIFMSDTNPNRLPTLQTPAVSSVSPSSSLLQFNNLTEPLFYALTPTALAELHQGGTVPLLHFGDTRPIYIYAVDGSITLSPIFAKQARVQATKDINLTSATAGLIYFQNVNSDDLTILRSGRDIPLPSIVTNIGGPGRFELISARTLQPNVASIGNSQNPYLPSTGADIITLAGVKNDLDYNNFITKYLNPNTAITTLNYSSDLPGFVADYNNGAVLSVADAWAYFKTLTSLQQAPLIYNVFYQELQSAGQAINDPTSINFNSYSRVTNLFNTLFPGIGYSGDIRFFPNSITSGTGSGGIVSLYGGKIELFAPGGMVNVGLPQVNSQGILTVRGGDIGVYSRGNIEVDQSKIFTLGGGAITIGTATGNIDAGKGAKTVVTASPDAVTTNLLSGLTLINPGAVATGSGIGTLLGRRAAIASDITLIAPNGFVDAGDAGIRSSGNLTIAARLGVLNADNIQVAGKTIGVPQVPHLNFAAVNAASDAVSSVAKAAADASAQHKIAPRRVPSIITVNVVGFGNMDWKTRKRLEESTDITLEPKIEKHAAVVGYGQLTAEQRALLTPEEIAKKSLPPR